jgi:type I restriction enzyme S subunit
MNAPLLTEEFHLLAAAPNGVQRLRELILSLAVRGKLVPQDANDEPASELLKRIKAAKAKLLATGKLKQDKTFPVLQPEERPFDLPIGWEYIRLSELGEFKGGKTPSTNNERYWHGSIPWVSPKDMKGSLISQTEDFVTPHAIEDGLSIIPAESVLIVVRSGILRRTVPIAINAVPCTVNQDLKALTPFLPPMARYLQVMLRGFERLILTSLTKVGTTVESIKFDEFCLQPFPLPPLAEQHRIVDKVDELMALCDHLDAQQSTQTEAHERLVATLLDTLTQSSDAAAFAGNWACIAEHFDLLFDTQGSIDKLKQSVLHLATRGGFVSEAERVGWQDGTLADVVARSEAGWSPQYENRPREGAEWGVLKVSAVSWNAFDPDQNKALPAHLRPRLEFEVRTGDFLISRANTAELVAKSVVVNKTPSHLMLSDKTIRLHFVKGANPRFFCFVNNAPSAREYYARIAGGTSSSMKNVSRQQILDLPTVIPPLAEQRRIVAKVDELMAICDTLAARLSAVRELSSKFVAVVAETSLTQ